MKSYAIIGTGAIGGYCAVKLFHAGFDVHCLLNTEYTYVKQNGLMLIKDQQTLKAPVKAYNNTETMPKCDVLLITLKTTSNQILKNILPSLIHTNTVIVVLQNGIGIEQELAEFIPAEKIIGGMSTLKVTKISEGTIQFFGFDKIELAQYYPDENQKSISAAVRELTADFQKTGINTTSNEHLPTLRWKKLAANIPLSGTSVLFNVSTRDLIENPESCKLVLRLTREVIRTAQQCGADIPDEYYHYRLSILEEFKKLPINYMSMKEDFDAHRPLELQAIYQNAINIAHKNNITMPLTEKLYQQLLEITKN